MLIEGINPIAFKIGPISVHWYGIFMAISFLSGTFYVLKRARERGIDEDFILDLIMLIILSAIVGARLMFVLTNFPSWFIKDPLQVLRVWTGGLSWHGGLLGAFLVGWSYAIKHKVNPNVIADWTVFGLNIGYIIVRIGNIFNQEVLGRMTQFSFGRWPAQLVGSAIGVVLLIRFLYLEKKDLPPGYQFWSFLWYHQILRALFEETVRENPLFLVHYVNPKWGIGFFTLTQLITPIMLAFVYYMYKLSTKYTEKIDFDPKS